MIARAKKKLKNTREREVLFFKNLIGIEIAKMTELAARPIPIPMKTLATAP
jgi:hypothetical protein